jgi:hypothetical protein
LSAADHRGRNGNETPTPLSPGSRTGGSARAIDRAPAALSPSRDLRARRHRSGDLDLCRAGSAPTPQLWCHSPARSKPGYSQSAGKLRTRKAALGADRPPDHEVDDAQPRVALPAICRRRLRPNIAYSRPLARRIGFTGTIVGGTMVASSWYRHRRVVAIEGLRGHHLGGDHFGIRDGARFWASAAAPTDGTSTTRRCRPFRRRGGPRLPSSQTIAIRSRRG